MSRKDPAAVSDSRDRVNALMSSMVQVLVLAQYEDEVMEPLTRSDETRTRHGGFERILGWFVGGWYLEFCRERVSEPGGMVLPCRTHSSACRSRPRSTL